MRIAVIAGSTRPGRKGRGVAEWALEKAQSRDDAEFALLDVADFGLPLLDEPKPPGMGDYQHDHTKRWAEAIASFDGYVIVTAEYNHGIPGALKNALDFIYREWNDKAAGFVGYGNTGGARAIEQLRMVMGELKVATVRTTVNLSIFSDFDDQNEPAPAEFHAKKLDRMLDELVAWAGALRPLRQGA